MTQTINSLSLVILELEIIVFGEFIYRLFYSYVIFGEIVINATDRYLYPAGSITIFD
jgi:hypothetical protein